MDELAKRRWDRNTSPNDHSPREALAAILRDIDSGELDVEHVIVVYMGKLKDDDPRVGYYQSGSAEWIQTLGMLERTKYLLQEN